MSLDLFSGETCAPGSGGVSSSCVSSWLSGGAAVLLMGYLSRAPQKKRDLGVGSSR